MYQRYERNDDQYHFREHGMSSRSPKVSDSNSSGIIDGPMLHSTNRHVKTGVINFFFFVSTKQSDKSNAYTWRK